MAMLAPLRRRLRWCSPSMKVLLAATLAACGGPMMNPLDRDPYGGTSSIASSGSIMQLPLGMEPLRLATRRDVARGRVVEEIVLANDTAIPHENRIVTQTRWRGLGGYFPKELDNPFKQADIDAFVDEQFQGSAGPMTTTERRNLRGPHRYVLADMGDAGSCIYAWQFFDAPTETRGESHSFAVDMRYCVPDKNAERMLDLFDRMAVVAPL